MVHTKKTPVSEDITFEYLFGIFEDIWPMMVEQHPVLEDYLDALSKNQLLLCHLRIQTANQAALKTFIKLNLVALQYCFEPAPLGYLLDHYPDSTLLAAIRVVDECRRTMQLQQIVCKPIITHVTADVLVESSIKMGEALNVELFEILDTPPDIAEFIKQHLNRPTIRLH